MRILVTGVSSSPGYKIALELSKKHEVVGIYRSNPVHIDGVMTLQRDLSVDPEGVIRDLRPDAVVHVASIGNVDYCEENQAECYRVNVESARRIVSESYRIGSNILYISTDYVFDGSRGLYSEEDLPRPINYYGLTKLLAEEIVRSFGGTIVRISSVYGAGPGRPNFGRVVIEKLGRGERVSAANDQWISPTLNTLIGIAVEKLLGRDVGGIIHVAGPRMTRYEFALAICDVFGFERELVEPISIKSLSFRAPRPIDSSLRNEKAIKILGIDLNNIKGALEILKKELGYR